MSAFVWSNGFWSFKARPLGRERGGPSKIYHSPSLITTQNLVAPCHTMRLYVCIPKIWITDAHHSKFPGIVSMPRYQVYYYADFGLSTGNAVKTFVTMSLKNRCAGATLARDKGVADPVKHDPPPRELTCRF